MGKHLTLEDRHTIEIQLGRGSKQIEIAKVLKRSESSISREIKNNSVIKKGSNKIKYLALEANYKAYLRRWRAKTQSMKIDMNTKLILYIISELKRKDIITSPKSIAISRNKKEQNKRRHISHESIYKWLKQPPQDKYKELLLYKKGYKKVPTYKGSRIINRIGLKERPIEANDRTKKGHFEADLIVSNKGSKYAILTLIDRKTRLPRIHLLKNKSSSNIMNIIKSEKNKIGIKSVTFDNGMEFAYHYMLHDVGIDTFFCDPYSSWQKGSIENLNRIIRRFFPKGTDFKNYTQKNLEEVCNVIANSPREILGFRSPNQVHLE